MLPACISWLSHFASYVLHSVIINSIGLLKLLKA